MSSPTPPKKEPKELSNEVRMLLAFVLMGLILVVTPYAYRKLGLVPPETPKKAATAKDIGALPSSAPTTASGTPMSSSSAHPADSAAAAPGAAAVSAGSEQEQVLETPLYHVVFSNRGATVKSWTLKKFKDSAGKPLELVNQKGAEKVGYPFQFTFRDRQPTSDLNKALWAVHTGTRTDRQFRVLRRPHSRHQDVRFAAGRLHGPVRG